MRSPEYLLRLKLGLPVRATKGHPPIGYVLDRQKRTYYPKQDELEILLEVKEAYDAGAMSCPEIVAYLKEKMDIVISKEGIRKFMLFRAPFKIVKDSLEKREEAFKWMSQNLTQAESS